MASLRALGPLLLAPLLVLFSCGDSSKSGGTGAGGGATGGTGSSGTACTDLLTCCTTLSASLMQPCVSSATTGNEASCSAILQTYRANMLCTGSAGPGAGGSAGTTQFLGGGGTTPATGGTNGASGTFSQGGTSNGGSTTTAAGGSSLQGPGGTSSQGGSTAQGGSGVAGTSPGCPLGQTQCPKGCFDLLHDASNCGSCGYKCTASTVGAVGMCENGQCVEVCSVPGQIQCNGYCVNPKTDNQNCGECYNQCYDPSSCSNGLCACPGGGTYCGGSCIDTNSDTYNCGGCSKQCPWNATGCVAGKCVCPDGATECDGYCAILSQDQSNCGACGVSCTEKATAQGADPNSTICEMGACYVTGYAGANCDNAGACSMKSCDALCAAGGLIACDPNKAPSNCSGFQVTDVGGCGYYSDQWGSTTCDKSFQCSDTVDLSDDCGGSTYVALSGINCQCKGAL
jgi:hypothetical protein